ncbi:kinase-like domain-containing protein [Apiospora arundinis]
MSESTPIPEPPGLPILGWNVSEIDPRCPLKSLKSLADKYGEIYRLNLPTGPLVVLCSHQLVDEACDEKRFIKLPDSALKEIRDAVHDGLFTAFIDEENWGIAHRVLVPAFGPVSIRGMFDEMRDIAGQLAMKWARYGSNTPIMVTDDFTRLALDTLALCSMDYRFNSFYKPEMHPFVEAMGDFLVEAGNRSRRPAVASWFYSKENQKYFEDIETLRKTADEVLQERKKNPSDRKDLMGAMLNGVDSRTGKKMTDQSITDNLITFLIAGHETTSGLLSFTFAQLLRHPEVYRKAQEEVDKVVGTGQITVDHLSKLPYVNAILREILRLDAPIPAFGVHAKEDTLLAGKYPVAATDRLLLLLSKSHVDPSVYGDDAMEFKPERMLDENFEKLPKNAWKPFGNGARGCIGRPFAWQEAQLCITMLLQNFNFVMDRYDGDIKQTLTIKPDEFYMRAILRDGMTPTQLEHRLSGTSPEKAQKAAKDAAPVVGGSGAGKPMTVLYGSNSGTCEALAQRLASDAPRHGFKVTKLDCMDSSFGSLPKDQPTVVITASYEGQPPDNAGLFVSWAESIKDKDALKDSAYAVFGCGHHEWAQTFHRIPKLVNEKLAEAGAERLAPIGLADVASGDCFTDFEAWEDEQLWPALAKRYGAAQSEEEPFLAASISVTVDKPRLSTLRQDLMEAEVVDSRALTAEGEPVKRHLEIKLPSSSTYRAGDYLAVLPINPTVTVQRAMKRFALAWDASLTIKTDAQTSLPTNTPVSANDIFGAYVELAQPATKRNIATLAEATMDEKVKAELLKLAADDFATEIIAKRVSVLDLLEKFPAVNLPLASFLTMLPPMRVRQYSISSSPLWNPSHVTLTYSILDAPSKSGQGQYVGVASTYLSSLKSGDRLNVSIRPSHTAFHLPTDSETTPIICVAAGTGLAPFRGFVQERAAMLGAGRKLAPATLYYGCREPGRDDLYSEELAGWEKDGAVTVRRVYSRKPEQSGGCKYVQDAIWEDRLDVKTSWADGARLYICGSKAVGDAVTDVALKMHIAAQKKEGQDVTEEEAKVWWNELRNARYATDVFD